MQRPYGRKPRVDYTPPWKRASYGELFREHVGVAMDDGEAVKQMAEKMAWPWPASIWTCW